ncbi:MAG: glycosyltransferase family 39 protein [Planctomycetes bacterium]|nr:glycosyltransferase family 39 protein [Planctomycetota bacterium]
MSAPVPETFPAPRPFTLADPLAAARRWSTGTVMLVLAFFCGAFYLPNLGRADFDKKGEPREGAIVGEILDSGDWVLPRVNGHRLPEKPLFYSWLGALSALAFGLNEFAMRFPSALTATIAVVVTFALGEWLFNRRTGVIAALMLAVSTNFYALATKARIDMTLACAITLALAAFARGYFGDPARAARWYLASAVAMGIASLSKGPLGCVLPVWVVLVFLALRRDWRGMLAIRPFSNALVTTAVMCAWYLPAWWLSRERGLDGGPEGFVEVVLWKENIGMPLGRVEGGGHAHGFFYYVPLLFTAFFPWAFFLPQACWGIRRAEGVERARSGFVLVWFLAGLLMFSVATGKRVDYLVPLWPAAALLVGRAWDRLASETGAGPIRRRLLPGTVAWGLCAAGLMAVLVLASTPHFPQSVTRGVTWAGQTFGDRASISAERFLQGEDWRVAVAIWEPLHLHFGTLAVMIAFLVIGGAIGIVGAIAARPLLSLAGCWTLVAGFAFIVTRVFLPPITYQYSIRPFLEEVRHVVPSEAPLYAVRTFDYAMPFYLRRHAPDIPIDDLRTEWSKGVGAFAIVKEGDLAALREAGGGGDFIVRARSETTREAGRLLLVQPRRPK